MCRVEICDRQDFANGLCRSHYRRERNGQDINTPIRSSQTTDTCLIPGCKREANVRNWCKVCDARWKRKGGPQGPIKKNPTVTIDSNGYARVRAGHHLFDGRHGRYEHICVMEHYLNRYLVNGETVHHKNGNRSDNRLKNLELWNTSQPAGQRWQDKVEWAREILDLYGDWSS